MPTKKRKWTNRATRDSFYFTLHMRVVNAQRKAIQKLLDADSELTRKFLEEWKTLDSNSYFLSHDPEYEKWLEQAEVAVGEKGDEIILKRDRNFAEDLLAL